ncbi:hypothetical protein HYH02_006959 [Chlamydomonas schloesseri]|uniref:5'-nucleotidase n=1 Tax=Chlamydomonas schloesseri TaxID=2026947 RepID=A0A835WIV9_9CHLO|nr:hypothetical protein HYH02_006959 [Chlamydomonas schloesseri]|eukprot:KAG2448377.1 hypothetical protein HYH02_006959 [Chlamydomonas schloesseri]
MGAGCAKEAPASTAPTPEPKREGGDSTATSTPRGNAPTESALAASPTPPAAKPSLTPAAAPGPRSLTIAHFNDVYLIEPGQREPVGGAARLATKVKELKSQGENPLVLFSGDAYNPSLMSTMTMGAQMVPVLNEIGVHCSCMGNHDFDYGLPNLLKLNAQCKFPWLMANVLDRASGKPYADAAPTWTTEWNGIKVGVVGLVEEEWLETLGAVNTAEMQYQDFVTVGRKLAAELKADGAELLIALTHMREPNDRKLAAEVPEFHLILGGHDHHYVSACVEPHNNLLVKSGTDFRDLSVVRVELPGGGGAPKLTPERIPIVSAVPEDPATKAIVDEYMKLMGEKMDEVVVETLEPLDGRFQTVRTKESNLGNFVCDVWRKAAGADIAILNGGSLRSDAVHPAGQLKARDWVAILPMIDETVVLECTGAQVVEALENGVSQWPKLEGRFPQVSGVKFKFDPSKPAGARVVPGSVYITDFDDTVDDEKTPIQMDKKYRVAVKEYLAKGKDGFDVFMDCKVLVDAEAGVALPTALKNHFVTLGVLSKWDQHVTLSPLAQFWKQRSKTHHSLDPNGSAHGDSERKRVHNHGVAVHNPSGGGYCIQPVVEGRIVNIRGEDAEFWEKEEKEAEERVGQSMRRAQEDAQEQQEPQQPTASVPKAAPQEDEEKAEPLQRAEEAPEDEVLELEGPGAGYDEVEGPAASGAAARDDDDDDVL